MTRVLALVALWVGLAAPVSALTCMPFTIADSFDYAQKSPWRVIVVLGELSTPEPLDPYANLDHDAMPRDVSYPATLTGMQATTTGFDVPFSETVTVRVSCAGDSCAGTRDGVSMIAFVYVQDDGSLVLSAEPCGSDMFYHPTQAQIRLIERCMANPSRCSGK